MSLPIDVVTCQEVVIATELFLNWSLPTHFIRSSNPLHKYF